MQPMDRFFVRVLCGDTIQYRARLVSLCARTMLHIISAIRKIDEPMQYVPNQKATY